MSKDAERPEPCDFPSESFNLTPVSHIATYACRVMSGCTKLAEPLAQLIAIDVHE